MARDDYGAISVISDDEKAALGLAGSRKPDEEDEEKLFETIGKAADKIGETQVGKKIGTIITVVMLALLSGGANMSIIHDYLNGDEEIGPIGGCMQHDATNYNPEATFDDGSCNFVVIVYGCTNPEAVNYDPQATHDNGRCNILNQNGTGENNETTNETVYGCMDPEANNYNDKAEEDDGSCEYEEEESTCNHTEVYAWDGLSNGNYSRPDEHNVDFYIDLDTNCDNHDEPLPVLIYYDLVHILPTENESSNETEWDYDNYVYSEVYFNVSGWLEDEHWFEFEDIFPDTELEDVFNDIYDGYWFFYIAIYADYNGNGDYFEDGEYVSYETNWVGEDEFEEHGWVIIV